MTVELSTRTEITLEAVARVAWRGENVRIGEEAMARMAAARQAFMALLESDPALVVYGVTTGPGDGASLRLSPQERASRARRPPTAGASFGRPLPARVVRAIVLARLANFLDGHAAVRPEVAQAVAALLDEGPLPIVPVQGNGGAGEILALGHLFVDLGTRVTLEEKEGMALINGSPCAAALVADVALAARRRVALALQVFALSAEAFSAPLEAYAPALDDLWGDAHETAALRGLRALLQDGTAQRRWYQAPVSYRILPRVLGHAYRALASAERAAEVSLRAVSDNPVYIPPDAAHPLGQVFSTGGYHNGQAYPAIDGMAAAWADLCLLAERHTEKLALEAAEPRAETPSARAEVAPSIGILRMVQPAYWAEAQHAAQRTFLARGVAGQNDVVSPTFWAWDKERVAGTCLDAALAVLSLAASQALYLSGQDATPALQELLATVRDVYPPETPRWVIGQAAERLTETFTARVFATT